MARSALALTVIGAITLACTHPLQVATEQIDSEPAAGAPPAHPISLAVRPFQGKPDELFYFNALIEALQSEPGVARLQTDYTEPTPGAEPPDLILDLRPAVSYSGSWLNYLIAVPGMFVFAPLWSGFRYRAEVATQIDLASPRGVALDPLQVPVRYELRYTDARTTALRALALLQFFPVGLFLGGADTTSFDRGLLPDLERALRTSYPSFVLRRLAPRFGAAGERSTPL